IRMSIWRLSTVTSRTIQEIGRSYTVRPSALPWPRAGAVAGPRCNFIGVRWNKGRTHGSKQQKESERKPPTAWVALWVIGGSGRLGGLCDGNAQASHASRNRAEHLGRAPSL